MVADPDRALRRLAVPAVPPGSRCDDDGRRSDRRRVRTRSYGIRAAVVTNAPPYAELEPTPVDTPIRILHHGAAQRGRGLEEMLRLADLLDERFTLDFVLMPDASGFREALIERARHNPRVRFPSPVPMRELVQMANGYDIGLYLLPPNNFNQRYALPNKFFEFIQGRLALAIGPSPEMAGLVRRYGCGVVGRDFTPEGLAAELNSLDASQIAAFKQASHTAAAELCAERNAEIVLTAVDTALASRSESTRGRLGRRLMCGIAGIVGPAVDEALLATMAERMAHRGPDSQGCLARRSRGPCDPAAGDHRPRPPVGPAAASRVRGISSSTARSTTTASCARSFGVSVIGSSPRATERCCCTLGCSGRTPRSSV